MILQRMILIGWFSCANMSKMFIFFTAPFLAILEFPAPKKLTTRNAVRDKQTILSPFIGLTN